MVKFEFVDEKKDKNLSDKILKNKTKKPKIIISDVLLENLLKSLNLQKKECDESEIKKAVMQLYIP